MTEEVLAQRQPSALLRMIRTLSDTGWRLEPPMHRAPRTVTETLPVPGTFDCRRELAGVGASDVNTLVNVARLRAPPPVATACNSL